MAVLIKGMEIPKCCADCDFADFREFEEDRCSITKTIIHFHYKGRNSDCPIVEVPEHGRLIDAEELKEDYCKVFGDEEVVYRIIDDCRTVIEPS